MKKKYYVILACAILIIAIIVCIIGDKSLDLASTQVNDLYKSLGEVDLTHCGGLNTYSSKSIKVEDIPLENRLCLAYYNIDKKDLNTEVIASNENSSNKSPLCKIGDSILFATDQDEKNCTYSKISQDQLNASYLALYGKDIPNYVKFDTSSNSACFLEEGSYYCGTTETYNLTLTPDTRIYRLLNKAIQNYAGEIIIEDYFLRITDKKCYKTNDLTSEDSSCSEALAKYDDFNSENDQVKSDFLKKYGQKYRHVFKQKQDNTYYWYSSYQK